LVLTNKQKIDRGKNTKIFELCGRFVMLEYFVDTFQSQVMWQLEEHLNHSFIEYHQGKEMWVFKP
jgi:hypothetical protein